MPFDIEHLYKDTIFILFKKKGKGAAFEKLTKGKILCKASCTFSIT
jgi:hypothetical protein